jgi:hypothetical protein
MMQWLVQYNDTLIGNNGELNHSLVIVASDFLGKQSMRICDWFRIECEWFLSSSEFEDQAIFKENLNVLDGSQHLPSRIEELDAWYIGVSTTWNFLKVETQLSQTVTASVSYSLG